jgi:subtilisin family serine protease
LKVVQHVYPCTYVVWGEAMAPGTAATANVVRWTGPFLPAYRVLPQWRNLADEPQRLDVLLYRGADTDAAIGALEELGGRIGELVVLNETFMEVGLTLSGAALQAAAQVPGVYSIQPVPTDGGLRGEMSDQVCVNNVDENNQAFPGYLDWLSGVGLSGAGVIIANVDGGIQGTHPDLTNRMLGCLGQTCGGSASSSHGTHTAGIMAADGSSGTTDGYGFLRGLGQAPGSNLVEQVYYPWYTQTGGMLLLMTDSCRNGASLSGNSWGPAGTPRGYDNDTMQVDIGVRDADPDAPGNQPLSYVLSFMNGYGGTSTQGTPDEAKNIFNIGSTKMQTYSGAQILQIDDLSSNTAHGPALDGRTIPHMVAPGCYVDSTTTGSSYSLKCGTSMASPHVSGAVALFIEYYRGLPGYMADPSPALVKAAFIAVAHDLAGHYDADNGIMGHPFDNKQGWGRMDVEAVVDPQLPVLYFDNPVVLDNTGETWTVGLSPFDMAEPMRLMLVWTDAPGHGLGGSTPAWNNDLDLVVEIGADVYHGNDFGASGWSVPGDAADGMNNTEGVFLGPTSPVTVRVRVIASDINSDGIPNQGDTTDQDFALVCYNCVSESGSVEVPSAYGEGPRYLEVTPQPGDQSPVALLVAGDVNDPDVSCVSLYVQGDGTLGSAPVFRTPAQWGTVHVHDEALIPGSSYRLLAQLESGVRSQAAEAATWMWGDVNNSGVVNITDVLFAVNGFQGDFTHATLQNLDLAPCTPDGIISIDDVLAAVNAFVGDAYHDGPCPMPCP